MYSVTLQSSLYSYGDNFIIIPAFFFRKKGYINFVSKSVRLSVRTSVLLIWIWGPF